MRLCRNAKYGIVCRTLRSHGKMIVLAHQKSQGLQFLGLGRGITVRAPFSSCHTYCWARAHGRSPDRAKLLRQPPGFGPALDFALTTYNDSAIVADADRIRIPRSGNKPNDIAFIRFTVQVDYRDGICSAVRNIKSALIRRQSQPSRVCTFEIWLSGQHRRGGRGLDLSQDAVLHGINNHDRITVIGNREQNVPGSNLESFFRAGHAS